MFKTILHCLQVKRFGLQNKDIKTSETTGLMRNETSTYKCDIFCEFFSLENFYATVFPFELS